MTPYVGKRRALPLDEAVEPVVETPAPYVGKRRAAEPAPEAVIAEPAPDTAELTSMLERELYDTAPRPRVELREEPIRPVPAPRPAHESIAHLFADDSRVDIPVVGRPTDFSFDQTAVIPLVDAAKGKRKRNGRGRRVPGVPSLPVLAGVASLAIAVTGVLTTGHGDITPAASHRLVQATALGGQVGTGTVGTRSASLSRNDDRSAVEAAAAQRGQALDNTNAQAGNYDSYLLRNQWGLPIAAGVYHLTGRFGDVSGLWATIHTGLDFACAYGTPIHAVASGVITSTGYDGSYGNKTVETLSDGTELWYAHQSAFGVSVGQHVTEGEVIGYVGATGNVTGPHVHLEVRPGGGDPVDPDAALKAHDVDPDANQ